MNFSNLGVNFDKTVQCASFSSASTHVLIGGSKGICMHGIMDNEEEGVFHKDIGDVHLAEHMNPPNIILVVTVTNPKTVALYQLPNMTLMNQISFIENVIALKINQKFAAILLKDSIHIFNLTTVHKSTTLNDMSINETGCIAFSYSPEAPFIGYPSFANTGLIQLYNLSTKEKFGQIQSDPYPISMMCFNPFTTMIAVASVYGLVINVYTIEGLKTYVFRRGSFQTNISSVVFSNDGKFLVVSSSTKTVHIFKTPLAAAKALKKEQADFNCSRWDYSKLSSFLPSCLGEKCSEVRSFARLSLPEDNLKSICNMLSVADKGFVFIIASDGRMYTYKVDTNSGKWKLTCSKHAFSRFLSVVSCSS